jgi:rhodanese-related sulfurtransferase
MTTIKHIDVEEFKTKMDNTPNLVLIDVRELNEWQEMRIPGAVHIPKDQVAQTIESQMADKNQPIYLHCRGGVRSVYAGQMLLEKGYTDVYSIDGGILDWANHGYPVEQ